MSVAGSPQPMMSSSMLVLSVQTNEARSRSFSCLYCIYNGSGLLSSFNCNHSGVRPTIEAHSEWVSSVDRIPSFPAVVFEACKTCLQSAVFATRISATSHPFSLGLQQTVPFIEMPSKVKQRSAACVWSRCFSRRKAPRNGCHSSQIQSKYSRRSYGRCPGDVRHSAIAESTCEAPSISVLWKHKDSPFIVINDRG